jgi:hypothetical protein
MLAWLAEEEQAGGRAERSGAAFGWIGEQGEAKGGTVFGWVGERGEAKSGAVFGWIGERGEASVSARSGKAEQQRLEVRGCAQAGKTRRTGGGGSALTEITVEASKGRQRAEAAKFPSREQAAEPVAEPAVV